MFHATITKADNTTEQVMVYEPEEFTFPALRLEKRGSGRRGDTADYYDALITFDTETSKLTHYETDRSGNEIEMVDGVWIYQWAMNFCGEIIAGRTAQSLISFLRRIYEHYQLDAKHKMVAFCHNLSFDSTFLLNGLWIAFDKQIKIFATGQRRPIRITCGKGLELRCSYKLTNKSLEAWCEDVQPEHKKMVGEVDYSKLRTPESALSESDWDYMINDVVCQRECLQDLMRNERLRTVPMTSTGFVRRAMRNAAQTDKHWHQKFIESLPTALQYQLLNRAFVGGYTHCNSFALGIWHDVRSFDAASMYPAVLATEKFPVGKWRWRDVYKLEDMDKLCSDPYVCVCCDIYFDHIRLKDKMTWNPYISAARTDIHGKTLLDNGKVISADSLRMAMTEIDYKIIMETYDFDWCAIISVMECPKKPLPKWFLDAMRKWYADKTLLKGATDSADKRRYTEAKQRLNAIYGMCATAWARNEYDYDFAAQDWKVPVCKTDLDGIEEALEKIQKPTSKAFLPYQWGCWTTSYARARLFQAAKCCENPLYCDTDSVKGTEWNMEALEEFNAELRRKSDVAGFTLPDRNGGLHPIGVFEEETPYVRFSALHAKCYAGEQINKKTGKVTIKKGLKKGSYKVKVKITAAGNQIYKKATKTVVFKIKVV